MSQIRFMSMPRIGTCLYLSPTFIHPCMSSVLLLSLQIAELCVKPRFLSNLICVSLKSCLCIHPSTKCILSSFHFKMFYVLPLIHTHASPRLLLPYINVHMDWTIQPHIFVHIYDCVLKKLLRLWFTRLNRQGTSNR